MDFKSLNSDLPLNLKELEIIIDEVSQKYPTLKKSEISLIIKCLMETLREQLLKGKVINIHEFLPNMKLYTFCKLRKNKLTFNTKIQVTTPKNIR